MILKYVNKSLYILLYYNKNKFSVSSILMSLKGNFVLHTSVVLELKE